MKPLLPALALAVVVGCSGGSEEVNLPPRPVSFVTLRVSNPSTANRVKGSVESWKREDIGFEIPGRIRQVIEPGTDIIGRTYDEQGKQLSEGNVLAELDRERYELARKQANAAVAAARDELEKVIPAQIAQAQAALDLANKELERFTNLFNQKSASKQQLDIAQAGQKRAKATVASAEALRATKASALQSLVALAEQADVNLEDCTLRSPFTGQVARVQMIPGGFVLAGQSVVTVQMMDPVKIDIAVSPDVDARINHNDRVRVFLPDTGRQLSGYVYLKDTFADPATRTYLLTLLVRNQKIDIGFPDGAKTDMSKARRLWRLERATVGEGNYYMDVNAIHGDEKDAYVWKVENLTQDQLYENFSPILKVRKVPVKLGAGRVPLLQVFTFRELTDIGGLDPAQDVIVGELDGKVADGDEIALVRRRWLLRPGDLVDVDLRGKQIPNGFYVPELAIQYDGKSHFVAIVEQGDDGKEKAALVEVKVGEVVGDLQQIEELDDKGRLTEGTKVISEGAHYVKAGDPVRAVQEQQLSR